jgi:hypothetical protein
MLQRVSAVPGRRVSNLCVALLALVGGCRDGCDESPRQSLADAGRFRDAADVTRARGDGSWHVTVMPAFAQGAVRAGDVEEAIRSHDRALETCANTTRMPDVERVRVMLRLSIGGDGAVFDVTAVQPRPESEAIRGCVIQLVRAWSYPRSDAAATQALVAIEFTTGAM